MNRPLVLRGTPKHYHWGRSRQDSIICALYPELGSERPMAEYWLGSHPSGPSTVRSEAGDRRLDTMIEEHPGELIGEKLFHRFGASLPFLFKILSVNEPLSIQTHPDRELAQQLHRADPLNYPDSSHKPEVSVAITSSKLLCGSRYGVDDLRSILLLPEDALLARFRTFEAELRSGNGGPHEAVLTGLLERFPDDPRSILLASRLELIQLEPGDAIFIPAGVLHAHLHGELIECMANSDNVIRAGLTPKHRDIPALLRVLDIQQQREAKPVIIRSGEAGVSTLPVDEFSLERFLGPTQVTGGGKGPELIFSLSGSGRLRWEGGEEPFGPGAAFLIPASVARYELQINTGQTVEGSHTAPATDSQIVEPSAPSGHAAGENAAGGTARDTEGRDTEGNRGTVIRVTVPLAK